MRNTEKALFCKKCPNRTIQDSQLVCAKTKENVSRMPACPEGLWPDSVITKTSSYAKAVLGLLLGETVPDEEYQKRKIACFGENSDQECEQLKRRPDGRAYCGLCGCGSRDEVLLDEPNSKLRKYARIECKLGKFGEVGKV